MKKVIGLSPYSKDVNAYVKRLEELGFSKTRLSVVNDENSIRCLLGCNPTPIVVQYASWGIILGVSVYGIFALVAMWCDCIIYPVNRLVAAEIVIIGMIAGALIGGLLGVFIGWAEYEKNTHLYIQGVNIGESVIVLEAGIRETDRAVEVLQAIGCQGVCVLP